MISDMIVIFNDIGKVKVKVVPMLN